MKKNIALIKNSIVSFKKNSIVFFIKIIGFIGFVVIALVIIPQLFGHTDFDSSNYYTILCVLLGASIAFFIENYFKAKADMDNQVHSATIIYYDLKSIEEYIKEKNYNINIRYYSEWQNKVADCIFLSVPQIKLLYSIYDLVYNYNYAFNATKILLADKSDYGTIGYEMKTYKHKDITTNCLSALTKIIFTDNISYASIILEMKKIINTHTKQKMEQSL